MSKFTESSLDYNGVNDTTSEFKSQNSDKYKKEAEDVKKGIHFVYEENIIK